MSVNRNRGIDILKTILSFSVIISHIMYPDGIVEINNINSQHYSSYMFFYTIIHCVDNCYALISGYVSNNKKPDISKIINMWFQVIFYSCIIKLIFVFIGLNSEITITNIIKSVFPVTFNQYWYFSAYFALYLLMPFINKTLFSLREKELKILFVLLLTLFSIMGTFGPNPFNTQFGYSFLWITVMYAEGVIINRLNIADKTKNVPMIIMIIICVIVSWISKVYLDTNFIYSLTSVVSVFYSIALIIIFSKIKTKGILTYFSSYSFGIYLFDGSELCSYIKSLIIIDNKNVLICMMFVLLEGLLIFAIGLIIECIRKKLYKIIHIDKCVNAIQSKIISIICDQSD